MGISAAQSEDLASEQVIKKAGLPGFLIENELNYLFTIIFLIIIFSLVLIFIKYMPLLISGS